MLLFRKNFKDKEVFMTKYKLEQATLLNKIVAVPFYLNLLRKYNKLESDYEDLNNQLKDKVFDTYLKQIKENEYVSELENENLKLKEKIKRLKEDK